MGDSLHFSYPKNGTQASGPLESSSASSHVRQERQLLEAADIERAVTRMAYEILEANKGPENLVLLGIASRGYPLARRLGERIIASHPDQNLESLVGQIDVTMYRDDLTSAGFREPRPTFVPPSGIDARTVVLVDDVLYSGRTVRAALDAITELGRPCAVRLAVLVDRGHRELPIRADHVGRNLPTAQSERVTVRLKEFQEDGYDAVSIIQNVSAGGEAKA